MQRAVARKVGFAPMVGHVVVVPVDKVDRAKLDMPDKQVVVVEVRAQLCYTIYTYIVLHGSSSCVLLCIHIPTITCVCVCVCVCM